MTYSPSKIIQNYRTIYTYKLNGWLPNNEYSGLFIYHTLIKKTERVLQHSDMSEKDTAICLNRRPYLNNWTLPKDWRNEVWVRNRGYLEPLFVPKLQYDNRWLLISKLQPKAWVLQSILKWSSECPHSSFFFENGWFKFRSIATITQSNYVK